MVNEPDGAAVTAGFYDRVVVPQLVRLAMRSRQLAPYRARAVAGAAGRVLEFGIGAGDNLAHYGPAVRALTGVEPSAALRRMAARRAQGTAFPVEIVDASASALPFEAGSFDCVVTTWTLCTVADGSAALAEARRVLKDGGRLLFVEHGRAPDADVIRWQDRLNPAWSRIAGGCNLNRDIAGLIHGAGFSVERLETAYARGPRPMTYFYEGQARRR